MPLALLIIGIMLAVSALRGTEEQLGTLIVGDITGGFLTWVAAIVAIGALGYVPQLQLPSRMLLALVLLVLLLKNGTGFFSQFQQQFANPQTINAPALPAAPGPLTVQVTTSGTGGSGGILGAITGAAGAAKTILPLVS